MLCVAQHCGSGDCLRGGGGARGVGSGRVPDKSRGRGNRKRRSRRCCRVDDGEQAGGRHVGRHDQQGLVHGGKGITSEVFYPRLDIPNMQDMQYIVTDGSTFVDLERDATNHVVSMPDEKALEYTITNTDKRATPKYRITNTYITDPNRNTLLIRTRFQSLDGGTYQLYLLENPSMAGGGANNNAWWDGMDSALMSSGTETLFGSPTTIVSALKVASPNGFVAHDNGYSGKASDCYVDLRADRVLDNQFDNIASNGNVVQCGQVGSVGADTTFTVALGYGSDAASAVAAANGSLTAGFTDREAAYRGISPYSGGWDGYVNGLRAAPASVSSDTLRRRGYYVAAMALHAAEDKTFRGASVAGFATPWGDFTNGDNLNDGYHRVWGRDLYQQATGLIAAGDSAQALRMAQFMWNNQYISSTTPGDGTIYPPGSFPRYSPVSGISGATPQQLGCCEQLDQEAFAILLAWMTGLTDNATYQKIKVTANHIQAAGPNTTERWEEQSGKSPSSIAAEIAGLVAAADIARQNGDAASAASWESTADSWRSSLAGWTFTTSGFWDGHQYYERIDRTSNPNDNERSALLPGRLLLRSRRRRLRVSRSRPARRRPAQRLQRVDVALADRVGVGRQLHGAGDDAQRRHLLPPLQPRQLRREQQRLQRLARQRSQSLRTAVAGPFRRARRVRARERPLGQRLPPVDGRRDQRWLLRAGADLGPLGRFLLRARTADGQRLPAQLGRGPIPAPLPVDRRRLQPRHAVGGQGEVPGRRADPRQRWEVHRRRRCGHEQRHRDPNLDVQRHERAELGVEQR